jgi:hypothetical protein
LDFALQVSPDGNDVQCLSEDGVYCKMMPDCINFARCLAVHPTIVMPGGIKTLTCGAQHKQLHNFTNYESDQSWCSRHSVAAGAPSGAGCQDAASAAHGGVRWQVELDVTQ